jgi:hypothetical protein
VRGPLRVPLPMAQHAHPAGRVIGSPDVLGLDRRLTRVARINLGSAPSRVEPVWRAFSQPDGGRDQALLPATTASLGGPFTRTFRPR